MNLNKKIILILLISYLWTCEITLSKHADSSLSPYNEYKPKITRLNGISRSFKNQNRNRMKAFESVIRFFRHMTGNEIDDR